MRALVVEDDDALRGRIADIMAQAGFAVDQAADGDRAEFLGATESYDIVVLDLGLPGRDGISVLTAWRAADRRMPVLILTARDEWVDKVRGFRAGADDYVVKPVRLDEVVLRARSLIRRAAGHANAVLRCGALAYDTQMGLFTLEEAPLRLTGFESRLLAYLIHHPGRVVGRGELLEHLYDHAEDRDFNSIEVVIGRLRRKIGRDRIETLRGEGYRLLAGIGAAPPS